MKSTALVLLGGISTALILGCSTPANRRPISSVATHQSPGSQKAEYSTPQPKLLPPQSLQQESPSGRAVKSVGFRHTESQPNPCAACPDTCGEQACANDCVKCGEGSCRPSGCGEGCCADSSERKGCGGLLGRLLSKKNGDTCGEGCGQTCPAYPNKVGCGSTDSCSESSACGNGCGLIRPDGAPLQFGHAIQKPQLAEPMTDPVLEAPMPPQAPPEPDSLFGPVPEPPSIEPPPAPAPVPAPSDAPQKPRRPWPTRGAVTGSHVEPPVWPRLNQQTQFQQPDPAPRDTVIAPTIPNPLSASQVSMSQFAMPEITPRRTY